MSSSQSVASKTTSILGCWTILFVEDKLLVQPLLHRALIHLLALVEHEDILLLAVLEEDQVFEPVDGRRVSSKDDCCREVLLELLFPFLLRVRGFSGKSSVYRLVIDKELVFVHTT